MGTGTGGNVAIALVGHGIAQRIDAVGFVAGIFRTFQHRHGLHHMGMSADNDVKAHIAELLGHLVLSRVLGELILLSPVEQDHGHFRAVGLHALHDGAKFIIQLVGVVVGKVVHLALVLHRGQAVEGEGSAVIGVGPGVADHADFDAIHFHHGVAVFSAELGTQCGQTGIPHDLDGALDAVVHGVAGMVVGGEQHVKARILHRVDQRIGAVEGGVSLIGVVVTAEGGLQIGDGVVQRGHGILDVAENGGEVVAAVALPGGVKDGLVHQQVAHGAHGGSRDNLLHLRGLRGGRLCFLRHRRSRLRLCGLGQLHGVLCRRDVCLFIHKIDAQIDQQRGGGDHQHDQHRQHHDHDGVTAFGILGHWGSSFITGMCQVNSGRCGRCDRPSCTAGVPGG